MQIDGPHSALSEWVGEWIEFFWSKRPRPPSKETEGAGFYDGEWQDTPPPIPPSDPDPNPGRWKPRG
jgi:hypothetical protein